MQKEIVKPIWIARKRVPKFFPGLSPKSLANLASLGQGPKVYRRGRTVFYKFEELEALLKPETE